MIYSQRARDHSFLIEPIWTSDYRVVRLWCEETFDDKTWYSYDFVGGARFIFKSDRDATVFKLRWAGVEFSDG